MTEAGISGTGLSVSLAEFFLFAIFANSYGLNRSGIASATHGAFCAKVAADYEKKYFKAKVLLFLHSVFARKRHKCKKARLSINPNRAIWKGYYVSVQQHLLLFVQLRGSFLRCFVRDSPFGAVPLMKRRTIRGDSWFSRSIRATYDWPIFSFFAISPGVAQ
jgi:hypothetical protein